MKNRYTVDQDNRLVIKQNRKRIVSDGRLNIDKNNRLSYWLNVPDAWRRTYDLPNKVNFQGNWRLDANYDLELNLVQTKEQFKGGRLIIKGKIISIEEDTLVFEVKSYDQNGLSHLQILKLTGFWQADELNRISFSVKKQGRPDILTLEGAWQVNKHQQIIYNYEKTDLKTKTKTSHSLTFIGHWQIDNVNTLTYIFERSLLSRFVFRVQIETPNLYPQQGRIKYRLGIGIKEGRKLESKIISLYGTWKFDRKLGLSFLMDYGQGRMHLIEFAASIALNKKDEIIFALSNKKREPLGLYLTFTHKFLKKNAAEAFLRLKKLQRESGIEAGVRLPF